MTVDPASSGRLPGQAGQVSGGEPLPEGRGLADDDSLAGARLRRLRWRARRGLLENDIVLERYFAARPGGLSEDEVHGLDVLLDLTDPELLDLILGRAEPQGEAASPAARTVLEQLRAC